MFKLDLKFVDIELKTSTSQDRDAFNYPYKRVVVGLYVWTHQVEGQIICGGLLPLIIHSLVVMGAQGSHLMLIVKKQTPCVTIVVVMC